MTVFFSGQQILDTFPMTPTLNQGSLHGKGWSELIQAMIWDLIGFFQATQAWSIDLFAWSWSDLCMAKEGGSPWVQNQLWLYLGHWRELCKGQG